MIALALFAALACIEPSGSKITAGDLAGAVPALSSVPPDTVIGFAPQPGVVRRLGALELARLASIRPADVPESVCIEWRMTPPNHDAFRSAMQASLPEGAQLAVLDMSRSPVPRGTLRFPLSGLHGAVWRGFVEYAPGARYEVWARVDIQVPAQRVVAVQDLAAGTVLTEAMLREETVAGTPGANTFVSSLADAVGRALRRSVRQGTPLVSSALDRRLDVRKGDMVRVKVRAGLASIGVEAVALAPAAAGETIPVRVNETGRMMRVQVAGPGEASLQLGGGN
jgi:flagella basal body P-ring formation protein FlgA